MEATPVAGELPIASPFALMSSEATQLILARVARLDLPVRRCSPLSVNRNGSSVSEEDDDE